MRGTIIGLKRIKTWQLGAVLLLFLFVAATFLRLNNVGMAVRRDAVAAADAANQPDEIRARLYDLQRYVVAHMNADTGPFDLQQQYARDVKAALGVASSSATGQNSPQAKADAICNPNLQIHGYSKAYQDCMLEQLTKQGQVVDPASIKMPDPVLYRHNYLSPLLSLDFAGFSVVLCILVGGIILVRIAGAITLKLLVRRHYRGV